MNEIIGWDWKTVLSGKLGKPSWLIKIPSQSSIELIDVNSLWLPNHEEKLYAGCGDNKLYVFNLEDGSRISSLSGHTDYIHSVHGK